MMFTMLSTGRRVLYDLPGAVRIRTTCSLHNHISLKIHNMLGFKQLGKYGYLDVRVDNGAGLITPLMCIARPAYLVSKVSGQEAWGLIDPAGEISD